MFYRYDAYPDERDHALAKSIMGFWSSFGEHGNPNVNPPLNGSLPQIPWPTFGSQETYYILDYELKTMVDIKAAECDLWDSIPKPSNKAEVQRAFDKAKMLYRMEA